ncbi:MAG: hypothetical protein QXV17_09370 [Candidatus Micrarchaeaceae archaeon]
MYNVDLEKLDLEELEKNLNTVRQKIDELKDTSKLKKSPGEPKSLVKFTKESVILTRNVSVS